MPYQFRAVINKEYSRSYILIPFNVWEICKRKGNIPVQVMIDGVGFECKLIPKGNGIYVIPISSAVRKKIETEEEYDVAFSCLQQLSRITANSPYTKDKPIRIIDGIVFVKQPEAGYCGQACLAMLSGLPIETIIKITASKKGQLSLSKMIESLDYFGFSYEKQIYTHGQQINFPNCCIINMKGSTNNHLTVFYQGILYDPTSEDLKTIDYSQIIGYITVNG